ncbi:MAG: hypothetical protein OXG15_13845 [Gammaproteobacteria bacterium]|nr:hypothetical protein [Gammaproteobacteria bacterium]
MEIDEAVNVTQDRLIGEGETMRDLLQHFRNYVSPCLIGETQWTEILNCGGTLPITLAALPFGFELPLHDPEPKADLGVSLASGTRSATFFHERAHNDSSDLTAKIITRLFDQIESKNSSLQEIVGRKLMLEYDIGSANAMDCEVPGMFLRPGERPIIGATEQVNDVSLIVDSLVSSVGWDSVEDERANVRRAYMAQPEDTRMDSFGIFPSRERVIRLAIMGFKTQNEICDYLRNLGWPGETSAVEEVISRFKERVKIVRSGANIDVYQHGLGPTLGLTLIVKQRYTKDSRYWLDGLTDWDPFLEALGQEAIVNQDKLEELATWVSNPTTLFGKSGRYVLLRGIHHIKLVIEENALRKAKAYVFLVLSAGLSQ